MKNLIFMASLILSSSLQASDIDPTSPKRLVGTTIHLNSSIEIPPNKSDAYFQYGKRVNEYAVDEYYPNCNIEFYSVSDTARTISPDNFNISRIYEEEVYPFSGETAQPHEAVITISSPKQPDVVKITCSQWNSELSDGNGYLTIQEIKQALGSKFSFN